MRENDHIILVGEAAAAPFFSHRGQSGVIYRFPLIVRRLSGNEDTLNVLIGEPEAAMVTAGERYRIEGEVRSFNNRSGVGARLVISVACRVIEPTAEEHRNELTLRGVVVKPPVYRKTPMGREITDLMIASRRKYSRSDYLPVIVWGVKALEAAEYRVGDEVNIRGRLQSRVYIKNIDGEAVEKTAFEISASEAELL